MPRAGFKSTIPVLERFKVRPLGPAQII